MENPLFLSRKDLSKRWGVSLSLINKLAITSSDKLPPCMKIGGTFRYPYDAVVKFENDMLNNDLGE